MINDNGLNLNRIFSLASYTIVRQIVAIVAQLLLVLLLARVLGPEGNGLFVVALLVPTVLTSLLNIGIPSSNIYYLARNSISFNDAIKANINYWFGLSIVGVVFGYLLLSVFYDILFPSLPKILIWLALALFPAALLYSMLVSLLQGAQKFKEYNIAMILPYLIALILSSIFVWWLGYEVEAALISWGLGQFIGVLYMLYHMRLDGIKIKKPGLIRSYAKQCIDYGLKAYVSNLFTFLNYRADIFLINIFLNPAAAGIYFVAVRIAEGLWLISQSVSTVLLPRLSELHTNEEVRRQLTPVVARWVTYMGLLVAVSIGLLSEVVIDLLFGEKFYEAGLILLWLLPGVVSFNTARILASDIAARGRPDLNAWQSFITLITNVIGNILLIPLLGVVGAAIATTISYVVTTIVTVFFYSRLSMNSWWIHFVPTHDDFLLFRKILRKFF